MRPILNGSYTYCVEGSDGGHYNVRASSEAEALRPGNNPMVRVHPVRIVREVHPSAPMPVDSTVGD